MTREVKLTGKGRQKSSFVQSALDGLDGVFLDFTAVFLYLLTLQQQSLTHSQGGFPIQGVVACWRTIL